MPKQGQFAKAARLKQVNNFKVRHQPGQGNTIPSDQFTDYLVVRFALTAKKRVRPDSQETVQRFLIEIADQLPAMDGDLARLIPELIDKLNAQVPWQFWQQLLANWDLLQHFLIKEVPAAPLAERLRITTPVTSGEFAKLVAGALAKKGAAATLLNRHPDAQQTKQVAQMLSQTFYQDGKVDWQQVAALLAPLPYQPAPSLDKPTRDWLSRLSQQ